MGSTNAARLAVALYEAVIAPLVCCEQVHPIDPIDPRDATAASEAWPLVARELDTSRVQSMRLRHAHQLCPVDVLPPPSAAEWLLAAALNNVLHAANPASNSLLSPRRTRAVLDLAEAILDNVPPLDSVGEALGRHATFARVLELERVDVCVAWWSGSAVFRGRAPPARVLAWPDLRRVHTERTRLRLDRMVDEANPFCTAYARTIARLVGATPLTDAATCARTSPKFVWTAPSLALLATQPGAVLMVRSFRWLAGPAALAALHAAAPSLHPPPVPWAVASVAAAIEELERYAASDAP